MKPKTFFFAALSLLVTAACEQTEPKPESKGDTDCAADVCTLTGTFTDDLTLTADKLWLLSGGVFIGNDIDETVLTIEPGTEIFGETSTNGMLVIRRGSKIIAEGTADSPIIMSSSKEIGSRARGDWGGLVINGWAPINGCDAAPCEAFGEGGTGNYGGDDASDNSGILKYVRIEFAGRLLSPDNELNGIAFQGVGSGTIVDYVQIHMGKDDGIEFFGGTVNAKHLLLTGIADDNLDWTDGWNGKVQYLVAQQYDDAGDNGIEADNNAENNTSAPRSHPILSHITLIGSPESDQSDTGMLFREGTGADVHNAIVTGWNEACLDVDNAETFSNASSGGLVLQNSIFGCVENFVMDDEDFDGDDIEDADPWNLEDFVTNDMTGNELVDPKLRAPFAVDDARDFRPQPGSLAESGGVAPNDDFFDDADYRGAVDPNADWTQGWSTAERN